MEASRLYLLPGKHAEVVAVQCRSLVGGHSIRLASVLVVAARSSLGLDLGVHIEEEVEVGNRPAYMVVVPSNVFRTLVVGRVHGDVGHSCS